MYTFSKFLLFRFIFSFFFSSFTPHLLTETRCHSVYSNFKSFESTFANMRMCKMKQIHSFFFLWILYGSSKKKIHSTQSVNQRVKKTKQSSKWNSFSSTKFDGFERRNESNVPLHIKQTNSHSFLVSGCCKQPQSSAVIFFLC